MRVSIVELAHYIPNILNISTSPVIHNSFSAVILKYNMAFEASRLLARLTQINGKID